MFRHHGAAMYLFILRAMHDVTGDRVWLERYQRAKSERSDKTGRTRLEICAEGYPHDHEQIKNIDRGLLWIYVGSQGGLVRLADWETDESARAQYRAGLAVNARGALAVINVYGTFDNRDPKVFGASRIRGKGRSLRTTSLRGSRRLCEPLHRLRPFRRERNG